MIELSAVSKTYRSLVRRRTVRALEDLTLSIARGEVFGIAGPNGAGKSTLISLLVGFLHPTSGSVRVGGLVPRAWVERHGVSYLTELVALPPRWTVEQALRRLATLAGLGDGARPRIERAVEMLGLEEHRAKQVRQLSKGNLQRLGIAQALLDDSDLVILDEPTHGLDPVYTQRFRDIVAELRRPERTILIASHNLDELERLTDRVAILGRGRLQRIVGGAADETHAGSAVYRLVVAGNPVMGSAFPGVPVEGRRGEYRLEGELATLNAAVAGLISSGVVITAFYPEESRLEVEFRRAMEAKE
ncbi:MAG TPA: ABC transporter ATP-binding protein [Gemmatimonadales bacterium]|nr:ABC transporter ATP-binding protein [Gemmatimonadales bacterium]